MIAPGDTVAVTFSGCEPEVVYRGLNDLQIELATCPYHRQARGAMSDD